jgi:DNA-binding CsgD family transcriptional regulator
MRSRSDEIAAYFAEHALRLERLVRARVTASAATVEDACAYAWCQLVRRTDVALDERAAGWLYRVAVHEGWRLAALEATAVSYSPGRGGRDAGEAGVPEPVAPTAVDELVAARVRLESVWALPDRQRRAVLLFAFGLTYAEIAEHMDISKRTVDRLLRRATQRLRASTSAEVPPSERAVLERLALGTPPVAVARELGISAQTVNEHAESACRRLGVRSRAAAITLIGAST